MFWSLRADAERGEVALKFAMNCLDGNPQLRLTLVSIWAHLMKNASARAETGLKARNLRECCELILKPRNAGGHGARINND
jgi:hypothetical protein